MCKIINGYIWQEGRELLAGEDVHDRQDGSHVSFSSCSCSFRGRATLDRASAMQCQLFSVCLCVRALSGAL